MSYALATYLHDHFAGSHFAVKLLASLSDQFKDEELGAFARSLGADVKQDQETLQNVIEKVGKANLDLMESVGWLMEKASRFKLQRDKIRGRARYFRSPRNARARDSGQSRSLGRAGRHTRR